MNQLVPATATTKTCPRCAEEIKLLATGCRFCGAEFVLTTRGYCTQCHRVVMADGTDPVCPRGHGGLLDPTVETELAEPALPPPVVSAAVPPVPVVPVAPTAPFPTTPPTVAATTVAATGRRRRALATTTRQHVGFYLHTLSATMLAILPLLAVAIEDLRIWQREVGFVREFRTLGPFFVALGLVLAIAAPRQVLPRTVGGSRMRAVFGGRRAWMRSLPDRAGTRLLLGRTGLTLRIAVAVVLWVAAGVLFQMGFGDEFGRPGVERLPGATVTIAVIVLGLVGALLLIPGSNARVVEVDDEGEISGDDAATRVAAGERAVEHRRGAGVPPALLALLAAVVVIGAAIALAERDDGTGAPEGSDTPTATTAPAGEQPAVTQGVPPDDDGTGTVPVQPTAPPVIGDGGVVTIVGSNTVTDESSWAIDGETRRLEMYAELRNDGAQLVRIDSATITISDGGGNPIGTRHTLPFDQVLDPGEVTYLDETTPSLSYWEGETNSYPDGWASWEVEFELDEGYEPSTWDEVHLAVSEVVVTNDGGVRATGTITNDTGSPVVGSVEAYVALKGTDGTLLLVGWTLAGTDDGGDLSAGASIPFEIEFFRDLPLDGTTTVAGAMATPVIPPG